LLLNSLLSPFVPAPTFVSRITYHVSRLILCLPVGDARLVQIVLRHFEVDLVADGNADEILAQPAGNVREHLVAVGQFDPEHGAGQHLRDGSRKFDGLFFWHDEKQNLKVILPASPEKSM